MAIDKYGKFAYAKIYKSKRFNKFK